mmetsp:Transcript_34703/g.104612  ORF Transcript_34703/g.104612 Transcript_34703/m.104612 type:complete len:208 (+) Transcript_34703:670-1293(+)
MRINTIAATSRWLAVGCWDVEPRCASTAVAASNCGSTDCRPDNRRRTPRSWSAVEPGPASARGASVSRRPTSTSRETRSIVAPSTPLVATCFSLETTWVRVNRSILTSSRSLSVSRGRSRKTPTRVTPVATICSNSALAASSAGPVGASVLRKPCPSVSSQHTPLIICSSTMRCSSRLNFRTSVVALPPASATFSAARRSSPCTCGS